MKIEESLIQEISRMRRDPIELIDVDGIPCKELACWEKLSQAPVVSVVMVTYNHENYIRSAIEGVLQQVRSFDIELIIAEDASTDRTREIVCEYQRQYPSIIRVLMSESNVGMTSNALRALRSTRGKYVSFCEGDDGWSEPDLLACQISVFSKNPEVVLVSAGSKIVDHDGRVINENAKAGHSPAGLLKGAAQFHSMLTTFDLHFFTCSVMVDRLALERTRSAHLIFRSRLYLMDTCMWLGLAMQGDFFHIEAPKTFYRTSQNSMTRSRNTNWRVNRDGWLVRYYFARRAGVGSDVCDRILLSFHACMAEHFLLDGVGFTERWVGVLLACRARVLGRLSMRLGGRGARWLWTGLKDRLR